MICFARYRRSSILTFTVSLIFISASVKPVKSSAQCNQTCKGNSNPVPYPFGFSGGCKIPLNCTRGEIRIGPFQVENITPNLSRSLFHFGLQNGATSRWCGWWRLNGRGCAWRRWAAADGVRSGAERQKGCTNGGWFRSSLDSSGGARWAADGRRWCEQRADEWLLADGWWLEQVETEEKGYDRERK